MESAYFGSVTSTPEFMISARATVLPSGGPGRRFLLDIHYRAHPGVDAALELVHPGGKLVDQDGTTGGRGCRAS